MGGVTSEITFFAETLLSLNEINSALLFDLVKKRRAKISSNNMSLSITSDVCLIMHEKKEII